MRWTVSICVALALGWAVSSRPIAADARTAAEPEPSAAAAPEDTLKKVGEPGSSRPEWFRPGIPSRWYSFKHECELHVVYDPKTPKALEFRFVRHEVPILALRGHRWSSFIAHENVLLFTDYQPTKPGCAVESYDLDDGRRLWRTELTVDGSESVKPDAGSDYYTWAVLGSDKGSVKLMVRETAGRYTETLDPKTGKSLGRRSNNPPLRRPVNDDR